VKHEPAQRAATATEERRQEIEGGTAGAGQGRWGAAPSFPRVRLFEATGPGGPVPDGERQHGASALITSEQLLPPKPNELLMTRAGVVRFRHSPAWVKCRGGKSGSATPSQWWGRSGKTPFRQWVSIIQQKASSRAPEAPSVWPISGLVELHGR